MSFRQSPGNKVGVAPPTVGVRCDAGRGSGVGHAVRQLALAEELLHRGVGVVHLGTLEIPWLQEAYDAHGIPSLSAPRAGADLARLAVERDLTAVLLDGYDLDPTAGAHLRAAGFAVLAMVDDDFGAAQDADLYVDQNLGARPRSPLPEGSKALAGIEYALFRDTVLERRPATTARCSPAAGAARVLAVFGGTDPFGAAAVLTPLVLATAAPVELTVVAPDPDVRAELGALPRHTGQVVHAVAPIVDLPGAAVESDLAISASGSSVWELLCLGIPTAVVCVVDNQAPGYAQTVQRGVVAGLGQLDELRDGADRPAVAQLSRLLTDTAERSALALRGADLVDGEGRKRVADALLDLLAARYP